MWFKGTTRYVQLGGQILSIGTIYTTEKQSRFASNCVNISD